MTERDPTQSPDTGTSPEAQLQPLEELCLERESVKVRLGQAALWVTMASQRYNRTIVEMLDVNQRIREEQTRQ